MADTESRIEEIVVDEELGSIEDHKDVPFVGIPRYAVYSLIRRALVTVSLTAVVILVAFPIYWIFASAVRPRTELAVDPSIIPSTLTLDHVIFLLTNTQYPTFLLNTIIITTGVVVLTTTLATLGGYGLARIDIPYKKKFAKGILFGYMFPPILLAIPMYVLWSDIGMLNTYWGLILSVTAISLPFSIWLMWNFFQNVPSKLEEQAIVNGASRFQAFVEISLPIATPGVLAVGIFSFATAWGDYTMARVLMLDIDKYVLTTGIETALMRGGTQIDWPLTMAGSAIALIPPVIFVYFLQKYILYGFGGKA